MRLIAGQSLATAKLGDRLAQELFGMFHAFPLIAAFGETFEELLDQRRNRGATLGRNDPGTAIGGVVQ